MSARLRTLLIALLLGAISSAIGVLLYALRLDTLPQFNRTGDLVAHAAALQNSERLGFGKPAFDTSRNDKLSIITIDELSLKSDVGPWPFKRSVYGTLLKKLKEAGAKLVVFDVDFVEPSADPTQDAAFADGMRAMPTVLAYTISTNTTGKIGEDPPVPCLAAAAAGIGFSTVDSPGGYVLGQPPVITTSGTGVHADERLVSLPGAAYEAFTGQKLDESKLPMLDGELLLIPPDVRSKQDIATSLDYFDVPNFAHQMMSFSDAYHASANDLRPFAQGSIVYIGATAQALFDFSTTVRGRVPGLFINARLADQLVRGLYLRPAPTAFNILLIIALPLLVSLLFTLLRPSLASIASVIVLVAYLYANVYLFLEKLIWLDMLHVAIAMVLALISVALYRVLQEASQRRMVTNLFGMHVSPAIVKDILDNDDPKSALALKGKKVRATIFYSDIRGFTAMSETMTPEEIYAQLNEYFEEMCAIIFEYGGYVDKFIGDCVMAVFSAPYQTPDDPKNAIISAVKQQEKIRELSEKWKAQGKREFTVGMGLNTGDVVMGNLGASSRMNYTVIGDNVNLAARLYNVAKAGEIIISDYTYQEVKDIVVAEERESVMVKGKKDPIKIYNITAIKEGATVTSVASVSQPEPSPA